MDIMVRNFLWDYDAHCNASAWLRIWMEQVAEEYGHHKQAREHMVDMANWIGYPTWSIPAFDKTHPREPPPTIGHCVKCR